MNSIVMQMQNRLSQMKVVGNMSKSADIMKAMNRLVKVEGITETMTALQKEMMKAGIIEEMVDDAMDAADEVDEDAADEEVEKVMDELAGEAFRDAQKAPSGQVQQHKADDKTEEDD